MNETNKKPAGESFTEAAWEATKTLITKMVKEPYLEDHGNSFMIVAGNDIDNDVEVHGSYNTVAEILIEHCKKDIFLWEMIDKVNKAAAEWYKDHPYQPDDFEDEVDEDEVEEFADTINL